MACTLLTTSANSCKNSLAFCRFLREWLSPVQGHLRSLEKDEAKKLLELYQGGECAASHDRPQSVPRIRRDDGASQRAKGEPNTFGNSLSSQSRVEQAAPVNRRRALHPDRVRHATNATRASVGLRRSGRIGETGPGFDP